MISIIMPTYNRFEIVRETIQKTLAISGNVDFEVIVVNDGEELPFIINHLSLIIQCLIFVKNILHGLHFSRRLH